MEESRLFDVLIIGGGVVGLSILHSLSTTTKRTCVLIESNPHLLMGASGRNTGIICTGVDAPLGSLERCLIRDSVSQVRQFCQMMNIPMKECGSLVCTWPWDAVECSTTSTEMTESKDKTSDDLLRKVVAESWDAGDIQVSVLDAAAVQEIEPAISSQVKGAVHIPGEIVVDPWLFSIAFAVRAQENGAIIHTNFEYDNERSFFDCTGETPRWMVYNRKKRLDDNANNTTDNTDSSSIEETLTPALLQAKVIVNAAGINADTIQLNTSVLPSPPYQMRPRRGQYIIFRQPPSLPLLIRPIQPIPTEHTKGIFVFSSIYDQIIFGPTASEQNSKTDVTVDPDVAEMLILHGKRVLRHANFDEDYFSRNSPYCIGEYVGIRPATTHRDYHVHVYHNQQWLTVAGIRSTGLTASIGIGNYVARCIAFFEGNLHGSPASSQFNEVKTTPLPSLKFLVDEFHKYGQEECVVINCYKYRVTHPITIYGWRARTGLARCEE